jgi:hypothetical protein
MAWSTDGVAEISLAPEPARRGLWPITALVAGAACLVTFYAGGGLSLHSMTITEMALTLLSGVAVAVAVLRGRRQRAYGAWPVALLLAFTALTAISIVWSVAPQSSWLEAGRMLAYSGVFAASVALARVSARRWPAILGGLAAAAVVVCGFALLTNMFPGSLAPADRFARLQQPYEYWNALGLTAAMGAICCLWLGARRTGHALLSALAYPALGLTLLTLLLAYSRGALAALAIGLLLWFALVPLRLRSAALLILSGAGAGAVAAWDFSKPALSAEGVAVSERAHAGHQLAALTAAMLLALTLAGIAIRFASDRRHPSPQLRFQAGAALWTVVALVLIAFGGALAHSQRGLTGTISHTFNSLTNPNAPVPPNTPGRLTAVASVRARYWKEALEVFEAHPVLGSGADGFETAHLRYLDANLEVKHAHGFVVQTLSDLGLVGLVLALALLVAWMVAAGRATHPFNRRWSGGLRRPAWRALRGAPYPPERIGMLTMLSVVVVFGVHSTIDWTWYVPGDACVALLCAGWLAGRGPLASVEGAAASEAVDPSAGVARPLPERAKALVAGAGGVRLALAGAALVAALLAAWTQWQPLRSEDALQQAESQLASDPVKATVTAKLAFARDPLSLKATEVLAAAEEASGENASAHATLEAAVRDQPSNPSSWVALANYELSHDDPTAALHELQAAIYLNPESISPQRLSSTNPSPGSVEIYNHYVEALRAVKSASEARSPAASVSLRAARRRSGSRSARSRAR